jgi:hypothetical protein
MMSRALNSVGGRRMDGCQLMIALARPFSGPKDPCLRPSILLYNEERGLAMASDHLQARRHKLDTSYGITLCGALPAMHYSTTIASRWATRTHLLPWTWRLPRRHPIMRRDTHGVLKGALFRSSVVLLLGTLNFKTLRVVGYQISIICFGSCPRPLRLDLIRLTSKPQIPHQPHRSPLEACSAVGIVWPWGPEDE